MCARIIIDRYNWSRESMNMCNEMCYEWRDWDFECECGDRLSRFIVKMVINRLMRAFGNRKTI